ncbi:heparinase II/III family protein [Halomonas sp. SpR8]|uniref:heparinase II/III domain-containing protein n=1 Tax=Halomonas sp. SpR8 TaxID=3050463 RepID=UPI0027E51DBC|nr:heparinase II/III family protein [Halomonas sp. SpR8]MDQ7727288.1 heparinase II/III family protein [Halomonas sp. SpR8]
MRKIARRAEEIKHLMTGPDRVPMLSEDSKERKPLTSSPQIPEKPDFKCSRYRFRWLPQSGYASCEMMILCSFSIRSIMGKTIHTAMICDLYDIGKCILAGGGSANNDSGPVRSCLVGTSAHNTVETDDENYSFKGEEVYGPALRSTDYDEFGVRIEFVVDHIAIGVTHRRALEFMPGAGLICEDELLADSPRLFRQWFHFDPRWKWVHIKD